MTISGLSCSSFFLFFFFHLFLFDSCDKLSWFNQCLNCTLNPCTVLPTESPWSICMIIVSTVWHRTCEVCSRTVMSSGVNWHPCYIVSSLWPHCTLACVPCQWYMLLLRRWSGFSISQQRVLMMLWSTLAGSHCCLGLNGYHVTVSVEISWHVNVSVFVEPVTSTGFLSTTNYSSKSLHLPIRP